MLRLEHLYSRVKVVMERKRNLDERACVSLTDDEHVWEDDGHACRAAPEPQHQGLAGPHAGLGHHFQVRYHGHPRPATLSLKLLPGGLGRSAWSGLPDLLMESLLILLGFASTSLGVATV